MIGAGARAVATLLHEMKRRGKDCRFGVISMCIGKPLFPPSCVHTNIGTAIENVGNGSYVENAGTGMGAAAVFESGDSIDELCNARKAESLNHLSKDVR